MDGECYFGCLGRLQHTLPEIDGQEVRLCEDHSYSWNMYRALLISNPEHANIDWPDDFWPWATRMKADMTKETERPAIETRAVGTEIQAGDAIIGAWYNVPSGEVEKCVAIRNRGRGVQVGFLSVDANPNDPEDIRWLRGQTEILVDSEMQAAKTMADVAAVKSGTPLPPHADTVPFDSYPSNGLHCMVCGSAQRQTPSGPSCFNGHGGAPGIAPKEIEPQAVGLGLSDQGVRKAYPEATKVADATLKEIATFVVQSQASDLSGLAARTADQYVTPVYHKSLHIDWRTPKALFDAQVARWGPFWLDAAATKENKLAEYWLGPGSDVEDAFQVDWAPTQEVADKYGWNVWLNHPYSKGEPACIADCAKPKCAERGYHLERPIRASGDWMIYARDQVLFKDAPCVVVLTKAAVETQWWKEAVRAQPETAGKFVSGRSDPLGGPAREFMEPTKYKAATWLEFAWENLIVDVVEIEGRVDFDRGGDDGSAGFPSALVTFYKPGYR